MPPDHTNGFHAAGSAKCLVTGGAGFIGSHVATALLQRGREVVVLDDLSGGQASNVPDGVELVTGSICDDDLVRRLFAKHRFEYVFHLAAYAAEGLSHFIRRFNYETNVTGSVTLINQAITYETRCFVFASSIAVYGSGQTPMTEDLTPQPEDPYGIAKYAVELDLRAAHHLFGLNYMIFRPHNVYGERQNIGDKYRNVIGIFMNQVMQGQPCTIFGDGTQTRAFTHVSDVAPLMAMAVENPAAYGEVFNIGAATPYRVLDLANQVQEVFGRRTGVVHLAARNEVVHAFSDHSKSRRVFGVRETVPLDAGLRRMGEWVMRNGPLKTSVFGQIEVEKNLPASWRK